MKLRKAMFGPGPALSLTFLILLGGATVGCGRDSANPKPVVGVSVVPYSYLVDRIAEGRVEVLYLVPPGASPAVYEPNMDQLRRLRDAVAFVKVGHPDFPFEKTWLDPILREISLTVVDAAQGVRLIEGDPHIWLSPENYQSAAARVAATLSDILPEHALEFDRSLQRLLMEIDSLTAAFRAELAPHRGRAFLVFHPAWGYFAESFDLEQLAIEVEGKDPSPHDLAEIMNEARRSEIGTVFVQPQYSSQGASVVAESLGGEVTSVDPLGYDWFEMLSEFKNSLLETWQ